MSYHLMIDIYLNIRLIPGLKRRQCLGDMQDLILSATLQQTSPLWGQPPGGHAPGRLATATFSVDQ